MPELQVNGNHVAWTSDGPVDLTDQQEEIREEWKAYVASRFMGAEWVKARESLIASGLDAPTATETLMDAVAELLEDGWDDYKP